MLDIDFSSAGDNNLQPWSLCSCIGQDPQETQVTLIVTTLVKCVNDKDKSVLQVVRKGVDEIKKERAFHQFWSKVWVVMKVSCYKGLKRGEDDGKFVNESQKDVDGLTQIQVISSAEKSSSKVVLLVEFFTD